MTVKPAEVIAQAVARLLAGDLVAFPTETVYGLGADAANPAAVAKIFVLKGRPVDHPLIVHLASAAQMSHWARAIPRAAWRLADAFWPGPLTLILKRQAHVADALSGGQDTIGLRVPAHPVALELLAAFIQAGGHGLAAPSANRFGRISPTAAAHVRDEFGDAAPLTLDGGPCQVGIESTIVDLSRKTPVILRPGMISAAKIAAVIGALQTPTAPSDTGLPRVSGSLPAHYAPMTPLTLVAADELTATLAALLSQEQRIAVLTRQATALATQFAGPIAEAQLIVRACASEPTTYARNLYATLRLLDTAGCARILVEQPPAGNDWQAISDRLARAAAGSGKH